MTEDNTLHLALQVKESEKMRMSVDEEEQMSLTVDENVKGTVGDYNDLLNKPTLNGKEIIGDVVETDPTVPAWAKNSTKPEYTSEEVGALNVDDTISLHDIDEMFKQVFG